MSVQVELTRVDDDRGELIKFAAGKHVLGRGPTLKCAESKISRNHAILEISDKDQVVAITPVHANPCLFQAVDCDNDEFSILKKGDRKVLRNGDKISLLPGSWTYKFMIKLNSENKISDDVNEVNVLEESDKLLSGSNSKSRKRILPSWLQKLGKEEATGESEPKLKTKKFDSPSKKKTNVKVRGKDENTAKQKRTNNAEAAKTKRTNIESDDETQRAEEGNDNLNKENKNIQTTNSQSEKRRCPYGSKCYRKNSQHFEEFSHNDDNKDSDEDNKDSDEDDRPECEYGLDCYRKNPRHLKDFRHVRQKRDAAKKARVTTRMINDEESSNDSFIVDDEDDDPEYAATDSETDDEYSSLMDEAKTFIKRSKK